jgi:hypothetical protein
VFCVLLLTALLQLEALLAQVDDWQFDSFKLAAERAGLLPVQAQQPGQAGASTAVLAKYSSLALF